MKEVDEWNFIINLNKTYKNVVLLQPLSTSEHLPQLMGMYTNPADSFHALTV